MLSGMDLLTKHCKLSEGVCPSAKIRCMQTHVGSGSLVNASLSTSFSFATSFTAQRWELLEQWKVQTDEVTQKYNLNCAHEIFAHIWTLGNKINRESAVPTQR